jgi:NADH dehydrogenase
MKIAITGGNGLIGSALARHLAAAGHSTIAISRSGPVSAPITDEAALRAAFDGCDAVAHCAGINRELGAQTYAAVHVAGTKCVVNAARSAGVRRIAMVSFLRARPNCGSPYHESKWEAEEIVRSSGLDYTILKCGIVYGHGDHLLDHISRALHTFPVFAAMGRQDTLIAPVAVEDLADILAAALVGGRLANQTVAVIGPERLRLGDAVKRIATAARRQILVLPMPLWFHQLLAVSIGEPHEGAADLAGAGPDFDGRRGRTNS